MANSITDYLSAVPYKASESYPGFFIVGLGAHSYYTCSYQTKNTHKKQIVEITNLVSGQQLKPGAFEFHHIVERQHLADISIHGKLAHYYDECIPTIMMHVSEHQYYNSLLHMKEMRLVYAGNHSSSDWRSREKAAVKLAAETGGIRQLNNRLAILLQMYQEVYSNANTLQKIAVRILEDYQKMFGR